MKIALCVNLAKKQAKEVAHHVCTFLVEKKVEVVADTSIAIQVGVKALTPQEIPSIDFMIALGGDGTILHILHTYPMLQAPIVGINLGHLGFMTDIPMDDIYPSLQDLLEGRYHLEKRLTLEALSSNGKKAFAANEIVLHRAQNPSLIEIAIHAEKTYVNTFAADGVIIATPNGSTAYSLAAGGPILSPDVEAIVLTPINPHTISNRPIVLTSTKTIHIQYLSTKAPAEVRADGIDFFSIVAGQSLSIYRAPRDFTLVTLKRRDYFSTLRQKLGWATRPSLLC